MRKLIELGVAIDAAIGAADEWDCDFSFERDRKIRDVFMALPTVDAVPVVRCKDCKWYGYYSCEMGGDNWMRDGNGFCDRGVRKDGDRHDSN